MAGPNDKDIEKVLMEYLGTAARGMVGPAVEGIKGVKKVITDMTSQITGDKISDFFGFIDEGYRSIAKSMGQGNAFVNDIKVNLANAASQMSGLGLSAKESYEKAAKMNQEYVEYTGRNARLTGDVFKQLQSVNEVTGKSTKDISESFLKAGISLEKTDETLAKALNQAKAIGASGEIASKKMLDNLGAMDKFSFQGGIDGLAKMSAQATAMNVNMEKVLQKADELLDPEKAIETAAALQRLGVTQSELLDPMRLMNLAQNDPAELQKQMVNLSKEFVHMNEQGKIEVMPGGREKLKLVAQQLGLSADEMTRMAKSSFELDEKMKSIKFPDIATDEQKQMFANMAKLSKDGTYKIDIDGQEVGLEEAMQKALTDPEYMQQLEEAGKPKSMEEIAKEQLDLDRQQLAATLSIAESMGGQLATSKNILSIQGTFERGQRLVGETARAAIKPGGTRESYDEIINAAIKAIGNLKNPSEALKEFYGTSKNALKGVIDPESGKKEYQKGMNDLEKYFNSQPIYRISTDSIKELRDAINGTITDGNDLLKSKDGTIRLLPEDSIIAGTGIEKIMDLAEGGGKKLIENTKELAKNANSLTIDKLEGIQNSSFANQVAKFGELTKNTTSDILQKNLEGKTQTEKTNEKIENPSGTITLNFNFTADSNSAQFADKIVDMFKNNTELQQTVVSSIAKVSTGQGTYSTENFNLLGQPSGRMSNV